MRQQSRKEVFATVLAWTAIGLAVLAFWYAAGWILMRL